MTNGDDRVIQCVDCGEQFLFTAGEQAFYASRGLTNAPTRCRACREARKQQRAESPAPARRGERSRPAQPREMHPAVCAACGAETQVPFVPVASRPVFCRDCYEAQRASHREAGSGPSSRPPRSARAGRPAAAAVPVEGGRRSHGAVKWFNEAKGFGFIQEDGGEDVFVHFSSILGEGHRGLREGERVEFDVVVGPKGRQAANVERSG